MTDADSAPTAKFGSPDPRRPRAPTTTDTQTGASGLRRISDRRLVLPAIVGIAWIVVLCLRQSVWDVPVPTKPLSGDRVPADPLDLLWSSSIGASAGGRVQIATDRRFKNIVFEERCESCYNLRRSLPLAPGSRYYWRVQRLRGGKAGAWTSPIAFRVEE